MVRGAASDGRPRRDQLVGRERELSRLGELMLEKPVLTLAGAPGIGKTTLARAAMRELGEWFPGGVWFADLSEAASEGDVGRALARALEVRTSGGDVTAWLGGVLAGMGPALVVLDNFEQVVQHASATLGRWLAAAPEAGFLVTSRQRLGLADEQVFEVPPLSVPGRDVAFAEAEAVRLFALRARIARDDYQIGEAEIPAVTDLVRQLDGNPLAIELAAARMGVLTSQQLIGYLPERFKLLSRGGDDRHATIRGAIDWSWQMLGAREQRALAQLAVFRGGFSAAAAEAVLELGDDAPWLIDVLQGLRDKSLLRTSELHGVPDELRFNMYISVREYAWARAEDLDLAEGAAERHAGYFATESAGWSRHFEETSEIRSGQRLALELENLLAAHAWSVAHAADPRHAERAMVLALAADPLLARDGPFGLRFELIDAALTAADRLPEERRSVDARLLIRALESRGEGFRSTGRMDEACRDLERARSLAESVGDDSGAARSRYRLGLVRMVQGESDAARGLFEEALARARTCGDRLTEGRVLGWLGHLEMMLNRFDEAGALLDEAVVALREVGDRRFEAINSVTRAVILHDSGQLDEAAALYDAARAIHMEIKDTRYASTSLANLGLIAQEQGNYRRAIDCFQEGIGLASATGDGRVHGVILGYYARMQQWQGGSAALRAGMRRAIEMLERGGEELTVALFRGYLGSIEADVGEVTASEENLRAAAAALDGVHPRYLAAVELCALHLELHRAEQAARRGDAAQARAIAEEIRRRMAAIVAVPGTADRSADARLSAALVERRLRELDKIGAGRPDQPQTEVPLEVCAQGRWFRVPGNDYVSLQRRRALRLMLQRLSRAYVEQQDAPLSVEELQAAGWPGERMRPEAGARRVYTALWELRKMGLRDFLVRTDEGYYLKGRVEISS